MPYHRRKTESILDVLEGRGTEVLMEPAPGLDVERFYLERMMEAVGIPVLTVGTAQELHRRILMWTYEPGTRSIDLPAVIGKYLGTSVNINPIDRATFNRKARKHLWTTMQNYVHYQTHDIIYTEE